MKNKKGQTSIILFFVVIFIILVLGLVGGLLIGLIDWSSDTLTPVLEGVGMVDNTNVSQAVTYTLGNFNSIVQTFTWLGGVVFIVALISCIMFAIMVGDNTHPIFMGLFFAFLILLIFISIFVSNAYQDLYEGNDEIASRLQEQTILSFFLLYSPMLLTAITILTGIFIFVKTSGGGELG